MASLRGPVHTFNQEQMGKLRQEGGSLEHHGSTALGRHMGKGTVSPRSSFGLVTSSSVTIRRRPGPSWGHGTGIPQGIGHKTALADGNCKVGEPRIASVPPICQRCSWIRECFPGGLFSTPAIGGGHHVSWLEPPDKPRSWKPAMEEPKLSPV